MYLYLTATNFGQSSICTRATSRYLPSSGLKIDASPSFTSNQSLPKASMMLGLCVIRKVFWPAPCPSRSGFAAGDVIEIEGIGIGLIREGCAMPDNNHVSARTQRLD